jgi:UDP-N-acetylmuramoyl-tripeptide--D-alanyl-D-alanine ligase
VAHNGVIIIDDSYNANVEGAASALDVLSTFDGRKVLLTQGLVELGQLQRAENINLGRRAAAVADIVMLTGVNADDIAKGLSDAGYPAEKTLRYTDLTAAVRDFKLILRTGDVLLIQNDLPINY